MSSSDGKGTENFHHLLETIQKTSIICKKRYKKLPSSAGELIKIVFYLLEKGQQNSVIC